MTVKFLGSVIDFRIFRLYVSFPRAYSSHHELGFERHPMPYWGYAEVWLNPRSCKSRFHSESSFFTIDELGVTYLSAPPSRFGCDSIMVIYTMMDSP